VIQHIYDRHYRGADQAADFARRWRTLAGRIDEARFGEVLRRLDYQAGHAEEWRDAVNRFFFARSGIADQQGRVGGSPRAPARTEAEAMTLDTGGYAPIDVVPPEAASGGRAVRCPIGDRPCRARFRYSGTAGWFDLAVRYFDPSGGAARFQLFVAGQPVDAWQADDRLPSAKLDAHTSSRRRTGGVALRPGDEIRVEGTADAGDPAAFDYLEITPAARPPGRRAATPAAR
jgi:alpha-glucuronidase